MRKWLCISIVLFLVAVGFLVGSSYLKLRLSERSFVLAERERLGVEGSKVSKEAVENALMRLAKLFRLEDLESFVLKDMPRLSKGEREALAPVLRTKLFEANFRQGELLLARAGGLLRNDENHPAGREYVEQARAVYDKMWKLFEKGVVAGPNDLAANARLNYLKGVYFYRSLFFIKDPKTEATRVEELVASAMKHYSAVYPYIQRGNDGDNMFWRTDVAIELLQKQAKSMGAGNGNDENKPKLRLELLPSTGPNDRGPNFAIEGFAEGRR